MINMHSACVHAHMYIHSYLHVNTHRYICRPNDPLFSTKPRVLNRFKAQKNIGFHDAADNWGRMSFRSRLKPASGVGVAGISPIFSRKEIYKSSIHGPAIFQPACYVSLIPGGKTMKNLYGPIISMKVRVCFAPENSWLEDEFLSFWDLAYV